MVLTKEPSRNISDPFYCGPASEPKIRLKVHTAFVRQDSVDINDRRSEIVR